MKCDLKHCVSVAPMMAYTDRHARYFFRLLSKNVLLYTEMITAAALVHGDYKRLLQYDQFEHPLAIQLGGSDPRELAAAAKLAEAAGFIEVNLNIGCPSPRVKAGSFGACLMLDPDLVANCVTSIQSKTNLPVTIKCRIGVDEVASYEFLAKFVEKISSVGCRVFIIHARKALLNGLSPKQNREIPPLNYDLVYRLKKNYPELTIVLNGGIKNVISIKNHLEYVDGVMLGRQIYSDPWLLTSIEAEIFNSSSVINSRKESVYKFIPYIQEQLFQGVRLSSITRHILGLFTNFPKGKLWRRVLSQDGNIPGAGVEVIEKALSVF